jgi:hypothetical protein
MMRRPACQSRRQPFEINTKQIHLRAAREAIDRAISRPLCVIPEGAGPVKWAGSVWLSIVCFLRLSWVNASEA